MLTLTYAKNKVILQDYFTGYIALGDDIDDVVAEVESFYIDQRRNALRPSGPVAKHFDAVFDEIANFTERDQYRSKVLVPLAESEKSLQDKYEETYFDPQPEENPIATGRPHMVEIHAKYAYLLYPGFNEGRLRGEWGREYRVRIPDIDKGETWRAGASKSMPPHITNSLTKALLADRLRAHGYHFESIWIGEHTDNFLVFFNSGYQAGKVWLDKSLDDLDSRRGTYT